MDNSLRRWPGFSFEGSPASRFSYCYSDTPRPGQSTNQEAEIPVKHLSKDSGRDSGGDSSEIRRYTAEMITNVNLSPM